MPEPEPPSDSSSPQSPQFLIGMDSRGRWVVRDQRGLRGGLFVNRVEAVRFAMRETGRRPQAAILVSGILELDMTRPAHREPDRRAA